MAEYGYMEKARLRVRSVTYKDGRGSLRIMDRPEAVSHRDIMRHMRHAVNTVDEQSRGQITGYALVAWEKSDLSRWIFAKLSPDNPVWPSEMPEYLARVFRLALKPGQNEV